MVEMVYYTDEIAEVLQDVYQESHKPLLFLLHGLNTDSNNFSKPAEFQVCPTFTFFLSTNQSTYALEYELRPKGLGVAGAWVGISGVC